MASTRMVSSGLGVSPIMRQPMSRSTLKRPTKSPTKTKRQSNVVSPMRAMSMSKLAGTSPGSPLSPSLKEIDFSVDKSSPSPIMTESGSLPSLRTFSPIARGSPGSPSMRASSSSPMSPAIHSRAHSPGRSGMSMASTLTYGPPDLDSRVNLTRAVSSRRINYDAAVVAHESRKARSGLKKRRDHVEAEKARVATVPSAVQWYSARSPTSYRESGHVPGYAGHVRGYDHVAGRSFTRATHRTFSKPLKELATDQAGIPGSPGRDGIIVNHRDKEPGHIPGYKGHVPHISTMCGASWRKMTASAGAAPDSVKNRIVARMQALARGSKTRKSVKSLAKTKRAA